LEYYITHNWEDAWIKKAKEAIYAVYDEHYSLPSSSHYRQFEEQAIDEHSDNADIALYQHIFNKRQRIMSNSEHEVDIYLKGEVVEQPGINTLQWWHVSIVFT
jgi:hypothetical protein